MDVAEWLVLRGACQIVIALCSKSVSNQVTRRIGLLRSCHSAHVVLVSTPAATTVAIASNLLQVATSAAGKQLGAIFILPVVSMCLCCQVLKIIFKVASLGVSYFLDLISVCIHFQ
jgi:hypothetical protein